MNWEMLSSILNSAIENKMGNLFKKMMVTFKTFIKDLLMNWGKHIFDWRK